MRQSIETAVRIMRAHPRRSAEDIFERLLAAGIDRPVAVQLVILLPHAYGRVALDGRRVLFSNEYFCLEEDADDPCRKGWLDDLPLWREAIAFAKQELDSGVSNHDLLVVSGRSRQLRRINRELHGEEPRYIACFPVASLWPEFAASLNVGQVAEQKLPWWHIWTWFERALPSNYSRAEKGIAAGAFGSAIVIGLLAIGAVGYYTISLWLAGG